LQKRTKKLLSALSRIYPVTARQRTKGFLLLFCKKEGLSWEISNEKTLRIPSPGSGRSVAAGGAAMEPDGSALVASAVCGEAGGAGAGAG
jgi:hypothetical protein